MKRLRIYKKFRIESTYRVARRFNNKEILVAYDVPDDVLRRWKDNRLKGGTLLLKYLEKIFDGLDKFELILIDGNDKPSVEIEKESGKVYVNAIKWIKYIRQVDKIYSSYKISKYSQELFSKCRSEGIEKFFQGRYPEEIIKEMDQTIFSFVEKMLEDFDSLSKPEQKALVENIVNSKPGTIILERLGKLDKSSATVQLKSLSNKIDQLKPSEVKELLKSVFTSKTKTKNIQQINKLPIGIQAKIINSSDKAAKLVSLYEELEKSLNDFQKLIDSRRKSNRKNEKSIHAFLADNYWLLGIQYFNQVIRTDISPEGEKTGETYHKEWRIYPDFEIHKLDGTIDKCIVIELEEANDKIFNKDRSLSKMLLDGLFQAIEYTIFHRIEKDRFAKGIAVLGSVRNLTDKQRKKLEKLSEMFPFVEIKTYEDLIEDSKQVIYFMDNYLDKNGLKSKP